MNGPASRSKSPRSDRRTSIWNSGSLGAPRGRPSSNGTQREREGLILSVCSRTRLIPAVGIPSASMWCCSPPTARVQFGQTGIRITAVTPSSFRSLATWDAVSFMRVGSVAPINE